MVESAVHGAPDSRPEAEFVHQRWRADARELAPIRAEVHRWLARLPVSEDTKEDLVLAVNEAVSNSVEHAYSRMTADPTVELTFWTEAGALYIEIVDHGAWQTPPEQPGGRGLGIRMMQRLIEAVLIHYDSSGTKVLLRHPLPGEYGGLPSELDELVSPNQG